MAPFGFEPKTDYLEGSCSIQLSYGVENGAIKCRGGRIRTYDLLVPNQARYRATLHPEKNNAELWVLPTGWSPGGKLSQPNIIVERGGFEPPVTFRATAV